jgi:pilus assembly protein TadC
MSDELFKALVIIGIFVIPFFILFAIDEQSNNVRSAK